MPMRLRNAGRHPIGESAASRIVPPVPRKNASILSGANAVTSMHKADEPAAMTHSARYSVIPAEPNGLMTVDE